MKVIREVPDHLLSVGKWKALKMKKTVEEKCWCSKSGLQLNAKHIISCCKKVSSENNAHHDIVVNILLNNTQVHRGLITNKQKWEDRKMVRTPNDVNHSRDGALTVGRVEQKMPGRWCEAEAGLGVASVRLRRRMEEGRRPRSLRLTK